MPSKSRLIFAWQHHKNQNSYAFGETNSQNHKKSKAVPLHAMEALVGRGGLAPTHSRPRH
jgi:hypothetical protein